MRAPSSRWTWRRSARAPRENSTTGASAGPRTRENARPPPTRRPRRRCALEAHRAQARRDVDAARQEAARADRASNRLLLMLVLAAVGVAALTHRAVVTLPRKLARRTSRAARLRAALSEAVASNERAANACVQKIAEARSDGARMKRNRLEACDAAAAETSRALADVAASHYLARAPVSAVARVVDVAAGARAADVPRRASTTRSRRRRRSACDELSSS